MKKIQGAEATVTIKDKVSKNRKEKSYRHPDIDQKIRRERTKQETRIIEKARQNGVKVPKIQETSDTSFEMQKIPGKQLKRTIEQQPETIKKLAEQVARLHSTNIIHGDLTTSNAILTPENQVYIIDFGLATHSERIEDKAVDLHLLKQILQTSHANQKNLWNLFKQKYREKGDKKVLEKLPEIEKRARYK